MAEHEADRDESRDESREPEKSEASGDDGLPVDEDAAWQAIVAGYGEEPADPPGAKPFKSVEDLALLESETNGPGGGPTKSGPTKGGLTKDTPGKDSGSGPDRDTGSDAKSDAENAKSDATNAEPDAKPGEEPGAGKPLGGSVSFAPGVGGPRDYTTPEPSEDDFDADDEGHFVPPDPPLPEADVTAKFAWLAVLGGPLLILLAVLFGWQMTWWLTTLGVGGFLGGFATLVTRMHSGDDEEDDDPGRGAVV
ncbi:hypothetical protein [Streptomyces sp. NPDC003006]